MKRRWSFSGHSFFSTDCIPYSTRVVFFSQSKCLILSSCPCSVPHFATLPHWISHSVHHAWNMLNRCVDELAALIWPMSFSYLCLSTVAWDGRGASNESVFLALSEFTDLPATGTHHGSPGRPRVSRQCTLWSGARLLALYTGALSWIQETSANHN